MLREKSIKSEKVPNHSRKIPNLVLPSFVARASLRKSLRPIRHRNIYEPHKSLGTLVFNHCNIRRLIYLYEACIIRLCLNGLKFLLQARSPKLWSHTRSLFFLIIFSIIIFFSMPHETKEGHLHVRHIRILQPHRPKIDPYRT
jgi:hypothetical protein